MRDPSAKRPDSPRGLCGLKWLSDRAEAAGRDPAAGRGREQAEADPDEQLGARSKPPIRDTSLLPPPADWRPVFALPGHRRPRTRSRPTSSSTRRSTLGSGWRSTSRLRSAAYSCNLPVGNPYCSCKRSHRWPGQGRGHSGSLAAVKQHGAVAAEIAARRAATRLRRAAASKRKAAAGKVVIGKRKAEADGAGG